MSDFPSQKQDKFVLRLPDGLRDRIKFAADQNGRSMNSEISGTLEKKYPAPINEDQVLIDALKLALSESGLDRVQSELVAQNAYQKIMHLALDNTFGDIELVAQRKRDEAVGRQIRLDEED